MKFLFCDKVFVREIWSDLCKSGHLWDFCWLACKSNLHDRRARPTAKPETRSERIRERRRLLLHFSKEIKTKLIKTAQLWLPHNRPANFLNSIYFRWKMVQKNRHRYSCLNQFHTFWQRLQLIRTSSLLFGNTWTSSEHLGKSPQIVGTSLKNVEMAISRLWITKSWQV